MAIVNVVLDQLNLLRETLGMDANYFYPAFFSILIAIITGLRSVFKVMSNKRKNNLLELYRSEESDILFVKIILIEIAFSIIAFLLAIVFSVIVLILFSLLNIDISLVATNVIVIIIILCDIIMLRLLHKRIFIRKKFNLKYKFLIIDIAFTILNIELILLMVFPQFSNKYTFVMELFFCIIEIIGIIYFRGRYIRYKYSKVTIKCTNGNIINCENVSKIKRKSNIIIIENKDNIIRLKYENISNMKFYGNELIILK